MTAGVRLQWVFDPVPASGARSGGDPSAFVFDARLDAFVREVLQNAVDARSRPDHPVRVRLVVDPLDDARAATLRQVLQWDALLEHLSAAASSGAGNPTEQRRFQQALEASARPPVVLWVEDRGTVGLDGPESGGGRFAALCRDRLFSDKTSSTAGGSFGLGKAVLWRFSRWSTVLFYSRPADGGRHRMIAKAALPWHRIGAVEYAGDGWLGTPEGGDGGERAISRWDDEAAEPLMALGRAPVADEDSGTTVGVLGFEDPSEAEPGDAAALARALQDAAEHDFWPAMARETLEVSAEPRPGAATHRAPWRQMLATYDRGQEASALEQSGDVVVCRVPFQIPRRRRGGGAATEAEVDLVVRLSHPAEAQVYELVTFRGPGMVVERSSEQRLGRVRPFHAIVVAGTARREPVASDAVVESFLRDAEPPSHDRWTKTARLREEWAVGYGKALERLHAAVRDALKGWVAPTAQSHEDGPLGLRALFPLPGGGGSREESAFRFSGLHAALEEGRWVFSGAVTPAAPLEGGWSVRIDARFPEDHGPGTGGLVEMLQSSVGSARIDDDGTAVIVAPAETTEVRFRGSTDPARYPVDAHHGALELVVRGVEIR